MNVRRVVVGVGSPHGWDRLGWQVIDLLAKQKLAADLIKCDGSGLDWINRVRPSDHLIFVDALIGAGTPGEIQCHTVTAETLESCTTTLSSHGFGLHYSIKLSAALGQLPPAFMLMGALARTSGVMETEVQAAAVALAAHIAQNLATA